MTRASLIEYIESNYGVTSETLWMKYPNYKAFRQGNNKKWFAHLLDVSGKTLGFDFDKKLIF